MTGEEIIGAAAIAVAALVSIFVQNMAARNRLKLDAYKQICDVLNAAADALAETGTFANMLPGQLRVQQADLKSGRAQTAYVQFDQSQYLRTYSAATAQLVKVIQFINEYLTLVDVDFGLTAIRIEQASMKISQTYDIAGHNIASTLPQMVVAGGHYVAVPYAISDEAIDAIERAVKHYESAADEAKDQIEILLDSAKRALVYGLFKPGPFVRVWNWIRRK